MLCHEDMAGCICRIEPFDEGQEDWLTYSERLELYFLVNGVAGERQVPASLSAVGSRMYGLLRNLTAPDKPCTKSYGELMKMLWDYLCPNPSIIAQRFRVHKCDQHDGELICDLGAELKRLSQHCGFGDIVFGNVSK